MHGLEMRIVFYELEM